MNIVHLYDDKGVKSCAKKAPIIRTYDLSKININIITCKNCRACLGKAYLLEEF